MFVLPGIKACSFLCCQDAGRKEEKKGTCSWLVQSNSTVSQVVFIIPSHSVIALIYLATLQLSLIDNFSFVKAQVLLQTCKLLLPAANSRRTE